MRGTKDEVTAAELSENLDRVKKVRKRFIQLIGLGEYRDETWLYNQLIESRRHHRPMRNGESASSIKPRPDTDRSF